MAITHKVEIKGLSKSKTNAVGHIHWELITTDGELTVSSYGTIKLDVADHVPFEKVTEKLAIKWVNEHLTAEGIRNIETLNRKKINTKRLQIESMQAGLPWQ